MSRTCPSCGATAEARFCETCGEKMVPAEEPAAAAPPIVPPDTVLPSPPVPETPKFDETSLSRACPECGTQARADARICTECGRALPPVTESAARVLPIAAPDAVIASAALPELPKLDASSSSNIAEEELTIEVESDRKRLLNQASLLRFRVTNNIPVASEVTVRMQFDTRRQLVEQEPDEIEQCCHFQRPGDHCECSFPFRGLALGEIPVRELRVTVARLNQPGTAAVFEIADQSLCVRIADPAATPQKPGIVISGGIHMDFSQLEMYGSDIKNLVNLNVQGEAEAGQAAIQWQPVVLNRNYALERQMPHRAAGGSPQLLDRAALLLSNGQRILLLAQSRITLGRERLDNCGQRSNDIVLRPWPRTTDAEKELARIISGVHLAISLTADGLEIEDQSSCGTYAGGEKFAKLLVTPDNFCRPVTFAVAGVLGLQVTCHRDPYWTRCGGLVDLIERQYEIAVGEAGSPLWRIAQRSGIDAVRLRRLRRMPIRDHLEQLVRCLDPAHFQVVRNAAFGIDPIDGLADREQYVLVFRTATIGGAQATDAIYLPESGLAAAHARILHLNGSFWLENLTDDNQVGHDGRHLAAHEFAPLAPGMDLSFGRSRAQFAEFAQPES